MTLPYFLGLCLLSGISTFILIKSAIRLFPRIGLVDKPHLYPHEKGRAPLPYPMGIILAINFVIFAVLLVIFGDLGVDTKKMLYIATFGLMISLIMGMDDQKRNLPPIFRLGIQIGVGAFFGLTAIKIGYVSNIFGGVFHLDQFQDLQWSIGDKTLYLVPFLVTIIWYVLVFNAYNWSDSGNGMSSGLATTTMIILMILSIKLYFQDGNVAAQNNSLFVLKMLAVLLPSVFVFWRFDVYKRFITGDSGTMFLGFMIASLAIVSGGKIATVAIALGVYLIDAFYVIIKRLLNKQNPMRGDLTHFHHRMAKRGFRAVTIRWTVYVLSLMFGLGAIFLNTSGKMIIFLMIALVVFFIEGVERKKR